jgi:50S ribosomal protein L16 3-hydroxylase
MNIDLNTPLLGGMSPRRFMQLHWQKKPLLVRSAIAVAEAIEAETRADGPISPVTRRQLFELASRDDVESRLLVHKNDHWSMRTGPIARTAIPKLSQTGWSLLVQGVDLHVPAARRLLDRFRFVPEARLDDVMVSYASDQGGVGPHYDSYDVFLLQVHGRRRWKIGRVTDPALVSDVPLKLLQNFEVEEEMVLEPGDMLYLPPDWAHDGVAEGECMTCSIGFRAPRRAELARDVMQRVLDAFEAPEADPLYKDVRQGATETPGFIPTALQDFAFDAIERLIKDRRELETALGEVLSEPKRHVWFEAGTALGVGSGVQLAARSKMLHDARNAYINGESFRATGRDMRLMRILSDTRRLSARHVALLSDGARELLDDWAQSGWVEPLNPIAD